MDIQAKALALKSEIMSEIQHAAVKQDTQKIIGFSAILEEAQSINADLESLAVALSSLEDRVSKLKAGVLHFPQRTIKVSDGTSARAHGEQVRKILLDDLRQEGIVLRNQKGSLYATGDGGIVGIAFATERQPGRWFLGLPERRDYKAIILLCEDSKGKALPLVLHKKLLDESYADLSHSGGQYKFNVNTNTGESRFSLTMPGAPSKDITDSLRKWSGLK